MSLIFGVNGKGVTGKGLTNVIFPPPTDAREVVPHNIDALGLHSGEGVRDVAEGFAHFAAFDRPVRVCEDLRGERKVERNEDGGKVVRVEPARSC